MILGAKLLTSTLISANFWNSGTYALLLNTRIPSLLWKYAQSALESDARQKHHQEEQCGVIETLQGPIKRNKKRWNTIINSLSGWMLRLPN